MPQRGRLRVALLGYRSAPFSGGQGVYLRYLSQALTAMGHQVTVISGPPYPDLVSGVALVKLPSLDLYARESMMVSAVELRDPLARKEWVSKLTGGFAEPWTFGERARDWLLAHADQFDVVHDNQTLADGILDLQRAGLPVVTTIHHPITRDLRVALSAEPVGWRRLLARRWHSFLSMQARVASQLHHIVTVSQVSATDIATDFGVLPSVIRVVPNGVDTSLFRPLPQIRRDPQQIVATASADAPLKGLHVLLRAFKQLREERPQQRLVLIARPKPGGDTEALIRQLDLADCIRFVGDASHDDINRLYAESAVAVVPSSMRALVCPRLRRWRRASRWCLATVERSRRWCRMGGCRCRPAITPRWRRPSRACWMTPHWRRLSPSVVCSVSMNIFAGQSARGRWFISTGAVLTRVNGRS